MEKPIVFIALVVFTVTGILAERPSSCPSTYTTVGSMCYGEFHLNVTWVDAQSLCVTFGGDLLAIENADQQKNAANYFQMNSLDPNNQYWLDANRIPVVQDSNLNLQWRFSGRHADPLVYFNWAPSEPMKMCGYIQENQQTTQSNLHWHTSDCLERKYVICTIPLATPDIVG